MPKIDEYYGSYSGISAITFQTNQNGTFNPSIATSDGSVATWQVSGEADQTTNTPSFTLDGTTRDVTMTIADYSKITSFGFRNGLNVIADPLDLTQLTGITILNIRNNSGLLSVNLPTTSSIITSFWLYNCGFTTLDLSGLTGLTTMDFYTNSITNVTFPNVAGNVDNIRGYNNQLTSVDLSGVANIGGNVLFNNNPSLSTFILPAAHSSGNPLTLFRGYITSLGVINWGYFATSDGVTIWIYSCGMTAAEVNENLYNLDNTGWINGSLLIHGTNAAPDSTSGGFDGITAKNNLIAKGWTVTTS